MTTKNFGAGVSTYHDVDGRNFETTVYQASKPVLDSELNQTQDIDQARNRSLFQLAQSGWLGRDVLDTSSATSGIFVASAVANQLRMPPMKALVNGWPLSIERTGGVGTDNAVDLGASPSTGLRTDLVVLEVWRRLLSASPSTLGKSQTARIWRNGNVKVAAGDDLATNFADDILDTNVGSETTKRVQIQYRLRVIHGVDQDGHPFGIDDPTVFAFAVPPNATTPDGSITTFPYATQSAAGDGGLWLAGDGNPANALGTVDGYIYALPLLVVFRRNTTAFNRDTNQNGGSGRPDGLTAPLVDARDIFDLRSNVSTTGWDLQELLTKNVNLIFDNALRTEQATFPRAGTSKGHTNIWADEIGPTDNPGPQLIRHAFDGVCRRFSDRPILETVVVRFVPTDQQGGGVSWVAGSTLVIDPTGASTAFRIYPYASANFLTAAPTNITILDIVNVVGADLTANAFLLGPYEDPATGAYSQGDYHHIQGLGKAGPVTFKFDTSFNFINTLDLYVTLLISYPGGGEGTAGGLTKTPTGDFGANSFVNESPGNLPASSPYLFSSLVTAIDQPHREALLTYKTLTHSFDFRLGDPGALQNLTAFASTYYLFAPERVLPTPTPTLTNVTTSDTYTGGIVLAEDGRVVYFSADDADWTPGNAPSVGDHLSFSYQSVRPIPNNSVQFTIWYETRAPQTIRDSLLGTTLTVIPRYIAPYLYTLVTGSGSLDEAYPFAEQYVQSPGVYPSSGGAFSGDHELDGLGSVSIADFNAETGFLQVSTLVPAVPSPQSLTFSRVGGDVDIEGRSFFKSVPSGYIPSAFGQPLSSSKRHKNVLPMLAELAVDGPIGPKGTLLIVLLSRWAEYDSTNFVGFDLDLSVNFTSASVYRLKGNPLNSRRS